MTVLFPSKIWSVVQDINDLMILKATVQVIMYSDHHSRRSLEKGYCLKHWLEFSHPGWKSPWDYEEFIALSWPAIRLTTGAMTSVQVVDCQSLQQTTGDQTKWSEAPSIHIYSTVLQHTGVLFKFGWKTANPRAVLIVQSFRWEMWSHENSVKSENGSTIKN